MPTVDRRQLTIEQALADPAANHTQSRELERVNSSLRAAVVRFCIINRNLCFHMNELELYVAKHMNLIEQPQPTPGSAGRILRLLAAEGVISYSCRSRRQSLYLVTAVRPGGGPTP